MVGVPDRALPADRVGGRTVWGRTVWGLQWRAWLWIAGYAVLVACTLNQTRPYHGDEAFYTVSAIRMVQGGDALVPHYFGTPRYQKPILTYWITAAGQAIFGVSLWSGRVGFLLMSCGLLVLVYRFAVLLADDHEFAFLSTVMLSAATLFIEFSRMSMPDVPLAFFATLALYGLCRALNAPASQTSWYAWAWGAMGAAFASKGFLAVAPALSVAAVLSMTSGSDASLSRRRLLHPRNLLIFAVTAFSWHAYIWWLDPDGFMRQFREDAAANLSYGVLQPLEHLVFYLWSALVYQLPFAAVALYLAVRDRRPLPRSFAPVAAHAVVTVLILAAFVRPRYPRYLLVTLPELTLLIAFVVHRAGLRAVAAKAAVAWASLQVAFFIGYPAVVGDPLKTLVSHWNGHLRGELATYELPAREESWVLALSGGRVSAYAGGRGAYILIDERQIEMFRDHDIVKEAVRLQDVRLDGWSLSGTYRRYLLIRAEPSRSPR